MYTMLIEVERKQSNKDRSKCLLRFPYLQQEAHLQGQQAVPGVHEGAAAVHAYIPQQRSGISVKCHHSEAHAQLHA